MQRLFLSLVCVCVLSQQLWAQDEEFVFNVEQFQPKPFEFTGYLELEPDYGKANQEGALYQLQFLGINPEKSLEQFTTTIELEGHFRKGIATAKLLTHSEILQDYEGETQQHDLFEGYLTLQPEPGLVFDVGKKAMRWGKGYAWNPVAFVERAKDAGDPDLAREGYWIAALDWIKRFKDPLQTFAVTAMVLPVDEDINNDFGEPDNIHFATKLYFLYRDIDIDLMFLSEGSRGAQWGLDFSKNLAPHFEIHGELAYFEDVTHRTVTGDCITGKPLIDDEISYLLGLRYRTSEDITFLLEYYYNGRGNNKTQQQQFYRCVHQAWEAEDETLLSQLPLNEDIDKGPFSKPNPMQRYLGFRSWWEEPADFLYLTAGLQILYNLDDNSYSIAPEVFYEGFDDIELRLRGTLPTGDALTEWGEKPNDYKLEAQVRLYF